MAKKPPKAPLTPIEIQRKNKGMLNLVHFKPGQSGNPAGRPKSSLSLTSTVKEYATEPAPREAVQALIDRGFSFPKAWTKDGRRVSVMQLAVVRAWHNASLLKGAAVLKELFERIDGKVPFNFGGDLGEGMPQQTNYDLKKLSADDIRSVRDILIKAIVVQQEQEVDEPDGETE